MNDLTDSDIQRQNILNNKYALQRIQEYVGFEGMLFEGEFRFTKKMVADFFQVDTSTIDRYLSFHEDELKHNGYILSKGKQLKKFKLQFGHLIDKATKTTFLGLFNFRSFLNLAMLLKESDNAQLLRSKMLDIVLDTINQRTGGGTKFINRRDANYLPSAILESKYRKDFTSALSRFVNMGNYKYSFFTDRIYQCIFRENAKEYKQILKLAEDDNARDTMYAEVLNSIASFETGLAFEIEKRSKELGRMLEKVEVDQVFIDFSKHPQQHPYIEDARFKMASRDLHFRDALHLKLEEYIQSVSPSDFERFLGEQVISFEKQLEDVAEVMKRLKGSE
jgi:hypothetical protein